MSDVYKKLAQVLDTLPNGFPAAESGVELKLLKKIFTLEEAELFCDMRLTMETPEEIAQRTGRPLEGLAENLDSMWKRGQLFMVDFGGTKVYKMMPWAFGIFEFQQNRMDREMAGWCEEYFSIFGKQFFSNHPQFMHVLPVEKEISASHESLPYETVSKVIEKGQSFAVAQCVCKQEHNLLDKGCDKPQEVCLGIAPLPGVFENHHWGRPIGKEDAKKILKKCEEAALVHLSWNIQDGQFFICNCCGCCCEVLAGINKLGLPPSLVVNSNYFARINQEECVSCGVCADERCQVSAIVEGDNAYEVLPDRCIGCGLCISTCPSEAISLVRKSGEIAIAPATEDEWYEKRAEQRGVDYSQYR